MRRALLIAALLAAAAGVFFYTEVKKDDENFNLVIFAFDGLQARHLAAYGYEVRDVTPNLDRFFEESYVFTNTISAAPWTVPSFMSMFTSLYPSEHKVTNKLVERMGPDGLKLATANLKELAPTALTLAEILKRNGFATGGFTGDAGVSGAFGFKDGFDVYYDNDAFGGFEASVPQAETWLQAHKNERFFMFVHGYDVHGQHAPKDGFSYRYVPESYQGPYTGTPQEQEILRERGLKDGELALSSADIEFWRAIYDEKIANADTAFGSFLATLKREGLLEKTVIAVVSDHGTEFFEHGRVDHGHTLYGELVETVFALRIPGEKGRKIDDLVSTMDIAPTLLAVLGVRDDAHTSMRGISLKPALTGKRLAHDAYSETDYRLYTHKRSITTPDGWKFILTRETEEKELYNLTSDSRETKNLISDEPKRAYELEQKLRTHLAAIGDAGPWRLGCLAVYASQCK